MTRLSKMIFAAAAFAAAPMTAFADGDAPPDGTGGGGGDGTGGGAGAAPAPTGGETLAGAYTKDNWPMEDTLRPVTFAKGLVQIHVDLNVNLSSDRVGKPISIAPDIWYGVNDKLSVGLVHGTGICLTGEDNGCAKLYNDVGFSGLYSVKRDAKMDLAAAATLGFPFLDPVVARLDLGVNFKYLAGKIAIYVDPRIGIGLNKRDGDPVTFSGGNKESLAIPVKIEYQANKQLAAWVRTGLGGFVGQDPFHAGASFDGFGDNYVIPLGIGAQYTINKQLDAGAELYFPGILGSDAATGDNRAIIIYANYRL